MSGVYVEKDCTFEHNGRKFTAGGAIVTPDAIVAYVGKPIGDGMGCDRFGSTSRRALNDWHGRRIGTCYIYKTWRTPHSHYSTTMSQIYATVDGIDYTGRGAGEGFILRARRVRK